jgi:hypothetical protein
MMGLFLLFAATVANAADKPDAGKSTPPPVVATNAPKVQVIAYYFHATIRCETCLKIEKRAKEAMERRFKAEMADKRLVFRPVDFMKPKNLHFAQDYQLPCPSLVLVWQQHGKDKKWKLLGDTWELIEKPEQFDRYVETETDKLMQETGTSVVPSIEALSELNKLAQDKNAVFVLLPGKDGVFGDSPFKAVNNAKQSLETRFEIKIGVFALKPGSPDYDDIAAQISVPGLVAIVKTGVRTRISGDLTEEKIVDGFLAAVASGGCCPLGELSGSK